MIQWNETRERELTAREAWGERFADITVEYLDNEYGWWALVVVPRRNGSVLPPELRMTCYQMASVAEAKRWCEKAIAFAKEVCL